MIVLVFGPVFYENPPIAETLDSAYICVVDPRQYDIRDSTLYYVNV